MPKLFFDPAGEENLEQLAPESSFLERKTIARQLLRDRARTLPHVAGGEILQRGAHDAEEIVTAVLIEFRVLHRDDGIDEIARQLVVRNGLPILDVDLPENLVVAIDDDAGRFHLFELTRSNVSASSLRVGGEDEAKNKRRRSAAQAATAMGT